MAKMHANHEFVISLGRIVVLQTSGDLNALSIQNIQDGPPGERELSGLSGMAPCLHRLVGLHRRHVAAAFLATVAGLSLHGIAKAAPVPWSEEPLTYTVVDQELKDLLNEVGSRLGVRVRVSDQVKGRVRGRLPSAAPQEFLTRLAAIYAFEWFYDGGILWVSAQSESQTRLLQLDQITLEQVTVAMTELGAADPRWPLRGSGQAGVIMVNGPPRYVAMAEQTLAALQQRMRPIRNGGVIVFRGS